MPNDFQGVFPALVTPMTADEAIDLATLAGLVEYLIAEGRVHGLVPLGSTGEYYALTAHERHDVLKTTLEAAAGRVPVLAGANAGSTREVVDYCQQAEKLGAAGVLLAAPYYSLPTADELVAHFRAVSDSIGIPVVLYNYPGRTGVDMTPELIERLAELDRVRYVKESSGDVTRVSEIIRRLGDRMTVFCGCDTLALESFVLGAVGWIGGVVNVVPQAHVDLYELAVVQKDFLAARRLYYKLLPVLALMEGGGKYGQYVKAGCQLTGHPVGPPRRPLLPAADEELARLEEALRPFVSARSIPSP
ncbi:MAG: 4-hydroxy-tetrahydrodipicolinate synthase [Planctomycetota bacterium]